MFSIPFYKPSIGEAEISEVVDCLRSGWLTSGPSDVLEVTRLAGHDKSIHYLFEIAPDVAKGEAPVNLLLELEKRGWKQQAMVQILQEALTNVRKHSGAKNLLVRLSAPEADWNLAIIDDGRGFGFEGKLSHAQLDERKLGPLVIKERVRVIHGELEIESVPGHGARLDVRLPKRIYA